MDLLRPVRAPLTAAVALQTLAGLLALAPLLALSSFTGAWIDHEPLPQGALVVSAVIAVLGAAVAAALATWIAHRADANLTWRIQTDLARVVRRAPLPTVTGAGAARIKKVVQDDTAALHYLVAHTLLDVTGLVVTPVAGIVALLAVDWRLALISVVPLVLGVAFYLRALRGSGAGFAEFGRTQQQIGAAVVDYVHGLPSAKVYGGAGGARERYLAAVNDFHDFFRSWSKGTSTATTASWLVVAPGLTAAGIALIGGIGLEHGWFEARAVVAGVLLGPAVSAPVAVGGPRLQAVRSGLAAATSVRDFLAQPTLTWGTTDAHGPLRLENVTHHYDGEHAALDDVSFTLPERGLVALAGASGSGKSTVAAMLARFTDPDSGRVLLGGTDLREIGEDRLYERVGLVFQDTGLRRASVIDNLTGGRPVPREQVVEATRRAGVHDEIMALPGGYDCVLGQEADLSGGQRQRVCLARALLRSPGALVLDEALSAVDPTTAAGLVETLREQARERTVLVISHQMPVVRSADLILVLQDGRLAGRGTHADLLETCPAYRALHESSETIAGSQI
ncbi:ABC transporter ATP-binding protein [Kineosporia sp. J2-2]|uniref:ABC transporter ATP-binding protein n=1 Tax=Kineosporia corallincola TaxID=2835133 RepID=A0ABS5TT90_9ACTN|nr:ABC transporter ATP-binding protein [Kineosporia corallincola]MBT0774006.1 ABC transporter ATP-binding protein [Kineosporia corallincola]